MASMDEVVELPEDFNGQVRLFPLPELVVFPHAMQPLHIFEPRYCDMLADALASDSLIAMATLVGGPGQAYSQRPEISPNICIGKIVSHVETEDGRHNILLIGAKRARVRRELLTNRSFRIADVDVAADFSPPGDPAAYFTLRRAVLDAFASVIPVNATVQQNLHELMTGQMGLGPITDIISFTLPLGTSAKLALLAQPDVCQRARLLIRLLQDQFKAHPGASGFPGAHGGTQMESGPESQPGMPLPPSPSTGTAKTRQFPPPFSPN